MEKKSCLFDFVVEPDSSFFEFVDSLPPTHMEPILSPQPGFSSLIGFNGSPQPSSPSMLANKWNTVNNKNRAIVDDDHMDPTPPNNDEVPNEQEWSGMLMRSPEHISWSSYQKTKEDGWGNLEGVGSLHEIDLDASFYMSSEQAMQNKQPCGGMFYESVFMENEETSTEHALKNKLPCGGMFSDWKSRHEEINPMKKRRRLEQAVEGETFCRRCKCQKSKCLMLYCGCFAAGVYCMGPCGCINCFNRPTHKDKILAARKQIELRKLVALAPKVIRWTDCLSAPRWHKIRRGCICKKGCRMKYCGCYEGGVECSIYCRCEGCKNSLGTKENGSGVLSVLEEGELKRGASGTYHLNKALEAGDSINAGKYTMTSVLAGDELDQSFGGGYVSSAASRGSSTTTCDNNLQGSSLLAKPLVSAFPQCFGQHEMASSAIGFASQPNHPFMLLFPNSR